MITPTGSVSNPMHIMYICHFKTISSAELLQLFFPQFTFKIQNQEVLSRRFFRSWVFVVFGYTIVVSLLKLWRKYTLIPFPRPRAFEMIFVLPRLPMSVSLQVPRKKTKKHFFQRTFALWNDGFFSQCSGCLLLHFRGRIKFVHFRGGGGGGVRVFKCSGTLGKGKLDSTWWTLPNMSDCEDRVCLWLVFSWVPK